MKFVKRGMNSEIYRSVDLDGPECGATKERTSTHRFRQWLREVYRSVQYPKS